LRSAFALDAGRCLIGAASKFPRALPSERLPVASSRRYAIVILRYVALVEQPGNASLAAAAQGPSEIANLGLTPK
jgi:hypothetical protein